MSTELAGKKVVIVVAPDQFRDEEFAQPHAALKLAGADITIASINPGKCYGSRGSIVHASMALAEASTKHWDAVVFAGGDGGEVYISDLTAHILIRQAVEDGAVLGAICMAPTILAHAGVLKGVDATVYPYYEEEVRRYGANLVDIAVCESANTVNGAPIITGNGPAASFAFGQAVVNAMRGPLDPFADLLKGPRPY